MRRCCKTLVVAPDSVVQCYLLPTAGFAELQVVPQIPCVLADSLANMMRWLWQAALERDIQETLHGWKAHLAAASFILIHAPSANAAALFAGAAPALSRSDPRVRGLPFATRHVPTPECPLPD